MTPIQRCVSLLIIALALVARIAVLDFKPPHIDEGVNGGLVADMLVNGHYAYNPANYHGPLHFYALFASETLFGRNLWGLRLPTVLIGAATVALVLAFRRYFSFRAVAYAAAFLAISPGMVFYSRYAIHEMWLPFFTLLAIHGGIGLAREDARKTDVWNLGLGIAGMILTKETWLLHVIAAGLAVTTMWVIAEYSGWASRKPRPAQFFGARPRLSESQPAASPLTTGDFVTVTLVSYGILIAFYSGFGMNWGGVSGMVTTFSHMMGKGADGEGHAKETFYWLKLLAHYELPAIAGTVVALVITPRRSSLAGLILFAAGFAAAVFFLVLQPIDQQRPDFLYPNLGFDTPTSVSIAIAIVGAAFFIGIPTRHSPARWLALYTLASLAAYSVIPYKTPWCIINIICPACLLLGHVLDRLSIVINPWFVALVAIALSVLPARSMFHLNFVEPTVDNLAETQNVSLATRILAGTEKPPATTVIDNARYAYVQTTFDINHLLVPLRTLVARDPRNRQITGHVFGEPSPLAWLLGDFPNIAYHDEKDHLTDYDAGFLIVPESRESEIDAAITAAYFKSTYHPRGDGTDSILYLAIDRFGPVLPAGMKGNRESAQ